MNVQEKVVNDIIIWIDNNLDCAPKIADVAKKAGYSKWHFQRLFLRVTKKNLGTYIRDRKLELAARDLNTSIDSVMYISLKYGYSSQQAFTRVFSQKYSIPPGEYRNRNNSSYL
jgi:AraC family of transcriptional regulator, multidrug resistance transcriptional activator